MPEGTVLDEQLVADVRATRRVIVERGWTTGQYESWRGGPVCAIGAARVATTGSAHFEDDRTLAVVRAVTRELSRRRPYSSGESLMSFNDRSSKGAVLALLDATIRAEAPFVWPAMPERWSPAGMGIGAASIGGHAAELLVEPVEARPAEAPEREREAVLA